MFLFLSTVDTSESDSTSRMMGQETLVMRENQASSQRETFQDLFFLAVHKDIILSKISHVNSLKAA